MRHKFPEQLFLYIFLCHENSHQAALPLPTSAVHHLLVLKRFLHYRWSNIHLTDRLTRNAQQHLSPSSSSHVNFPTNIRVFFIWIWINEPLPIELLSRFFELSTVDIHFGRKQQQWKLKTYTRVQKLLELFFAMKLEQVCKFIQSIWSTTFPIWQLMMLNTQSYPLR